MVARSIILLAISAIHVGRIDTPVLADGVGNIGPIALDSYPISFRKDILLHEAHRHPYIERLGAMYLMKVRYGNEFSTRAGATWRILFVVAMFPWLRKYRFPSSPTIPDELDFDAHTMEEGDGASISGTSNLDANDVEDYIIDSPEQDVPVKNVGEEHDDHVGAMPGVFPVVSRLSSLQNEQHRPFHSSSSNEASHDGTTLKRVTFPSPRQHRRLLPDRSGGVAERRKSLADMKIKSANSQNREVLLRLENESLRQQNRRLLEELQILRQQQQQLQHQQHRPRASSRSSLQSIMDIPGQP
jgi:hypothetical protein